MKKKAIVKSKGLVSTYEGYFNDKLDKGLKFSVRDTNLEKLSCHLTENHLKL